MDRRRLARRVVGAAGAGAIALGTLSIVGPASAQAACGDYPVYAGLARAAGLRSALGAPGILLVPEADVSLPESQAQFDSRLGSFAHAGAPYSDLVAGNIGIAGVDANELPVFAISRHPSDPDVQKSTPLATIRAQSGATSSAARTDGAAPASDGAATGGMSTAAVARCTDAGAIEAIGENRVDLVNVAGVLQLGSVRSRARAVIDGSGKRVLEGTVDIDGASILGQRVGINQSGLVVGPGAVPLPDDSVLGQALVDAGIAVRYIAGSKNEQTGEVFAPALEIVVARRIEGYGTGPVSVTYTLGGAYARASLTSDGPAAEPPPDPTVAPDVLPADGSDTGSPEAPVLSPPESPVAPSAPGGPAPAPPAAAPVAPVRSTIVPWSIARAYTAIGIGLLLTAISFVGWGPFRLLAGLRPGPRGATR